MTSPTKRAAGGLMSRVGGRLGIDFHLAYTLVAKMWTVIAGAGTVLLIPVFLTQTVQGYYYTFLALLGVLVFFELGINQVVTQMAAHEAAHLERDSRGSIVTAGTDLGPLLAIVAFVRRWSAWAAIIFAALVCPAGIWFFRSKGILDSEYWFAPWVLLVIAAALNLSQVSQLAFIEGLGQVGDIARLRLTQSVLGYVTMWLILYTTRSLYAALVVPAAAALCTCLWLKFGNNPIRRLKSHPASGIFKKIVWRTDVLPLQWRIALSWISGFFIYQAFVPVAFARQGPVEAGRLGLGISIFTAITTVSISWVLSKGPHFARLVAQDRRDELRATFRSAFVRAQVVGIVLISCVLLGIWLVHAMDVPFAQRIPTMPVALLLALAAVGNSIVFCLANFMHSHKQDPLVVPSALTAVLVLLAIYYGMSSSVAVGIGSYAAIVCIIFAPWTALIFMRFFRM